MLTIERVYTFICVILYIFFCILLNFFFCFIATKISVFIFISIIIKVNITIKTTIRLITVYFITILNTTRTKHTLHSSTFSHSSSSLALVQLLQKKTCPAPSSIPVIRCLIKGNSLFLITSPSFKSVHLRPAGSSTR